jgi:predicted DNA-binding protein
MADVPLSIRLPADLVARLKRLAKTLPEVTRSGALRIALDKGLTVMEVERFLDKKRPKKTKAA